MGLRSLLIDAAADCAHMSRANSYAALKFELLQEFGRQISPMEIWNRLKQRKWDAKNED